ncbi:MAG: hydroxyacylglutathione hydrolase [Achromobacter veterisilvae]
MQALTAPSGGRERNAAVLPLPAFTDNYIWAIVRDGQAAVVDPGEAGPVLRLLEQQGLRLRAILLTHHHGDHVGGVSELSRIEGITVYGPARERLPRCDVPLTQGDRVTIPELDLDLSVLDVPGHTAGHIAYTGRAAGLEPVLFCGDTLFAGGCGRLFEGTPAQMYDSLEKFSVLPPDTQVFCAHEYTLANLRWASAVEPANRNLQQWHQRARQLRAEGLPTLPSTIGQERATNPFLRTQQIEVVRAAERRAGHSHATPVEVFASLREWKNEFK